MELTELKTDFLKEVVASPSGSIYMNYEAELDALFMSFVPPHVETAVYYVDGDVAVLYNRNTRQIVGVQIEAFRSHFLAQHETLRDLFNADLPMTKADLGELLRWGELLRQKKQAFANEVTKAT